MSPLALLFHLFVTQPLVEYWVHRGCHAVSEPYHRAHHRSWTLNYWGYRGDYWVRAIIALLLARGYWIPLFFLAKYELTHVACHRFPRWSLANHHRAHHARPHGNFAFSAEWPDQLFGTQLSTPASCS